MANSTPKTPANLDAIRAAGIDENKTYTSRQEPTLQKALDQLVQAFEANRGHIGGVMCILLPRHGDVLVDPLDDRSADGVTVRVGLDATYHRLLIAHATDDAREHDGRMGQRSPNLATLLGSLRAMGLPDEQ